MVHKELACDCINEMIKAFEITNNEVERYDGSGGKYIWLRVKCNKNDFIQELTKIAEEYKSLIK